MPEIDLAPEMPPKGPKQKIEKLGIAPPYKNTHFYLAFRDPAPRGRAEGDQSSDFGIEIADLAKNQKLKKWPAFCPF